MANYLPRAIEDFMTFMNDYIIKIETKYKETLLVSDAELNEIRNGLGKIQAARRLVLETEHALKLQRDEFNAQYAAYSKTISTFGVRLKTAKNFTNEISHDLGMDVVKEKIDYDSLKPEIKITIVADQP